MFSQTIGFIGAGHLSGAIIAGLLQDKQFASLIASCKSKATAEQIENNYKIKCSRDNRFIYEQAQVLIIGVRPAHLEELLREMANYDLTDKLIITLVAGIPLEKYRDILGDEVALIRAMPNMAVRRQAALTGIYSDSQLDEDEEQLVDSIFAAVGGTEWLEDETQLDGVIALAASGIGLVFRLMEAFARAGESYGFDRETLYDMVSQTFFGAAVLALEEENGSFAGFVKAIATPGGTTAAGLQALEDSQIDQTIGRALAAVVQRSNQLGEELTRDW